MPVHHSGYDLHKIKAIERNAQVENTVTHTGHVIFCNDIALSSIKYYYCNISCIVYLLFVIDSCKYVLEVSVLRRTLSDEVVDSCKI